MSKVIAQLGLKPDALSGETVLVTGAGGGIGFEAARSLLWLGANVIIAEIDQEGGRWAEVRLEGEFGKDRVIFFHTDVGNEASVQDLYRLAILAFGKVDVVINNATIAVVGKVTQVPIETWDRSYRVNLRGPVLLAQTFIPDMIKRNHGVFVCVSSKGTAFLGGYETFKAAQLHLADTLDAELEGTDVIAYTIGPGLVPTDTASNAIAQLAPQMGMSVQQFLEMNKATVLSVEEAGAGFAVSVVFARKFRGQEISSMQALKTADINFGAETTGEQSADVCTDSWREAHTLCRAVRSTLQAQVDGWRQRSLFERQWVIRDFRKTTGMPVEEWLQVIQQLESDLARGRVSPVPLEKLAEYYEHLAELAKGYERDPAKLEENLCHIGRWRDEVRDLIRCVRKTDPVENTDPTR